MMVLTRLSKRSAISVAALILFCMAWTSVTCADVPFRLAVISERPDRPSDALVQYGPLNAYLRRHLVDRGIRVEDLVIASDLDETVSLIESGAVDALVEGVLTTLLIERRTRSIVPSLLLWRKGQRQYHTVFFVRRDNSIPDLQGLAGKRIVFESARSTSAYFMPLATLRFMGLHLSPAESESSDPNRVRYLFAGSELNQAYWVRSGRADAGAFNDGDWARIPESIRRDLRILGRTRSILRWLLSFSTSLDPDVRDALIRVLAGMHEDPQGRAALAAASHIAKIEPLTHEDRRNLLYWADVLQRLD